MRTPANKAARFHKRKPKRKSRYNLKALNTQEIKDELCDKIIQVMHAEGNDSVGNINKHHEKLISTLTKARDTLPQIPKNRTPHPWDDEPELKNLIAQRDKVSKGNSGHLKRKIIGKNIKCLVNKLRNQYLVKIASQINEAKQNRDCIQMWRKAKEHDKIITSKPNPIDCPGLKIHFQTHFNPDQSKLSIPQEILEPPEYITLLYEETQKIENNIPTIDEISDAIKNLKPNKSSIDVESEILQTAMSVDVFQEMFIEYIQNIWRKKELPNDWDISRITALWKRKGSPLDTTKYRGMSIGSILVKVLNNIILKRVSQFYEGQLLATQFGFRTGKGCNDGIYVCKQLQEMAHRSKKKLYTCYVDLSAAYDHINRDLLFRSIYNRIPHDEPTDCIDIIKKLYKSTKSYMAGENPSKDMFSTSTGVRQGGSESPVLFNLYVDYALRVYKYRCDQENIEHLNISFAIPNECTNREQRAKAPSRGVCKDDEGGYADDIGIHAWTKEDLDRKVNILYEVFKEFGLQINIDKTETMISNWDETMDGTYPEYIIEINNVKLNNVKHFKYLGVWNSFNDIHIGEHELNYRINSAKNAYAEHRKMLTNKYIHLPTRVNFLNSLVRSRLTYGCHAWRPTKRELSKLNSTYNYFLRSIILNGHKRVNAANTDNSIPPEDIDWRYKISNAKLYEITKTSSLEEYYHLQQQKWVSHITRRENNEMIKILTFYNIPRNKQGRPIPSILERAIHQTQLDRTQFLRNCFKKDIR